MKKKKKLRIYKKTKCKQKEKLQCSVHMFPTYWETAYCFCSLSPTYHIRNGVLNFQTKTLREQLYV